MRRNMKLRILGYGILLGICFLGGRMAARQDAVYTAAQPKEALLAVVIDDFGYHAEGTEEMLALRIPFTAAVMPFHKSTQQDAADAAAAGKEVILHMPMESLTGKAEWVGEKGIFVSMNEAQTEAVLLEALSQVPQAVGMNNHMGSAVVQSDTHMTAVAKVLAAYDLFFLDSMTTAQTCAEACCAAEGVTCVKRDVFLDSTDDVEKVKENLRLAAQTALECGGAVAIGHVGPEGGSITAEALAECAAQIEAAGVRFVTLGEYIAAQGK